LLSPLSILHASSSLPPFIKLANPFLSWIELKICCSYGLGTSRSMVLDGSSTLISLRRNHEARVLVGGKMEWEA
jgi:hypothetical protein